MLVITDVSREPPVYGDLFAGKKFWIAQRVPSRNDFVNRVKYNGGQLVVLEKHADYLIVDHLRSELPSGGISYRFIERSIQHSELQDPSEFHCGPPANSVREVGSSRPAHRGRIPFTAEDDNELYAWVKGCEARGCAVKGNEIYKDFEQRNNRHTWQSWRDRWVKVLSTKPPRTVAANPPPSPPSDVQPVQSSRRALRNTALSPSKLAALKLAEFDVIFSSAETVMEVPYGRLEEAWAQFSNKNPAHSGEDWARYFDALVKPIYADLVKNPARGEAYDEAWTEWEEVNGETATVTDWIEYYRNHVLPNFPPPISDAPEIKKEPDGEEQENKIKEEEPKEVNVHGQEQLHADVDPAELGTRISGAAEETFATPQEPSSVALGKRRREDTSPAQDGSAVATPSPKRRHTDVQDSLDSIQESIEASPNKKSPTKAAPETRSSASSSPRSSRSASHTPHANSQQHSSHPEFTVYDEGQDGPGSQPDELRVREALEHLTEGQLSDLLDDYRALPNALQEQDGVTLQDAVVMHTMHAINMSQIEESQGVQAIMDVFKKLEDLGVMEKLQDGEDESEGENDENEEQEELEESEEEESEEEGQWQSEEDEAEEEEEEERDESQEEEQEESQEIDQEGKVEREQEDVWLEVAQGSAETERLTEDDTASSPAYTRRRRTVSSSYNDHENQRRSTSNYTPRRSSKFTQSPQQQHARPTSSSGGTGFTSFEMATEPTYDLTNEAEAEAYISSRLAPPYNFSEEHIITALHATCAVSTAMADSVLRWMRVNSTSNSKKGRRSSVGLAMLPDERGVWTEEDDLALLENTPSERKRLEAKHGRQRCVRRHEFLTGLEE
ncbi:BRCT domain-containing protein [Lasiodiplodia theobromae]|nr:BRCT domain-containing protein [Lasiodiplodia theobromae]